MKRHLSNILLLLLLMVTTNVAQDGGNTYRIEFDHGEGSKRLKGSVDLMNPNLYVFPVREGQRMKVELKGDGVFIRLYAPSMLASAPLKDVRRVDEVAHQSGEYRVLVRCYAHKSLPYRLNIVLK